MSTTHTDPTKPTCNCHGDADLTELRALVAAGVDQFEASRLIWGPPTSVSTPVAARVAGRRTRDFVRTTLAATLPWLRLPALTEQESTT